MGWTFQTFAPPALFIRSQPNFMETSPTMGGIRAVTFLGLSVFDETTKRNRCTIIRGLMWWSLYKFLYFTKWAADTEWYQAIMYVLFCCFPDLSHGNIQGMKTHTVGNYAARPVLKDIQMEL